MFNLFKNITIKKATFRSLFCWNYNALLYICKKNILKKYLAILLIIVFAVRPVYYLGQVAYYGLNIDYIIETYCINTDKPELQCNGKCHLAKQLQLDQNTAGENDPASHIAVILEGFYPVFNSIQDYSLANASQLSPVRPISNYYSNTYAYLRDMSLTKPPKDKV